MNRRIDLIANETRDVLRNHRWPGNIRELENVIQRAVILSRDGRLMLPPMQVEPAPRPAHDEPDRLESVERAVIAQILKETNGMIGGPRGAAARLGLKRTTLQSMIKRLGLSLAREAAGSGLQANGMWSPGTSA